MTQKSKTIISVFLVLMALIGIGYCLYLVGYDDLLSLYQNNAVNSSDAPAKCIVWSPSISTLYNLGSVAIPYDRQFTGFYVRESRLDADAFANVAVCPSIVGSGSYNNDTNYTYSVNGNIEAYFGNSSERNVNVTYNGLYCFYDSRSVNSSDITRRSLYFDSYTVNKPVFSSRSIIYKPFQYSNDTGYFINLDTFYTVDLNVNNNPSCAEYETN